MLNRRGFIGGPWAFGQLFADTPPQSFAGSSYRATTFIPDSLTTYSDAEIQVMEPIESTLITSAWVSDPRIERFVQENLDMVQGHRRKVLVQDFAPAFANGFDEWG